MQQLPRYVHLSVSHIPHLLFPIILLTCSPGCGKRGYPQDVADSAESRPDGRPRIVVLGDSLTAGHTLEQSVAYPAVLQQEIDEAGISFQVVNAGVNGDTSTDGLQRLDWVLREPASVLLIELGGNDGLRGLPVEVTRKNLQALIDRAREMHPGLVIILAGMKMPPNYGREYTQDFESLYSDLAEKNNVALIPFLLEGVAGQPELNMPDAIHPTAEGHRILAQNVWEVLEPILREKRGG